MPCAPAVLPVAGAVEVAGPPGAVLLAGAVAAAGALELEELEELFEPQAASASARSTSPAAAGRLIS